MARSRFNTRPGVEPFPGVLSDLSFKAGSGKLFKVENLIKKVKTAACVEPESLLIERAKVQVGPNGKSLEPEE